MLFPLKLAGFVFKSLLATLALFIAALVVGGFLGEHDWRLDLLSHFRIVYMIALMAIVALFLLMRSWVFATLAATALLINIAPMLPYYWPEPPPPEDARPITLMQTNVWYRNPDCDRAVRYIREVNPDIIAVQEYDTPCRKAFRDGDIAREWPHAHTLDATWLAVFSKHPIVQAENQFSRNGHGSAIIARILTPQGPLTVITVHATRPKSRAYDQYQNEHMDELADIVQKQTVPAVVIGDLNTTPWSRTYTRFMTQSGLKDTQQGTGIQPSWPSLFPLNLPMLPIDHVLASPGIHVHHREIGPDVGSDHRPVVVRLSLPK